MALSFDGTDDEVDYGNQDAFDGAANLTIAFWISVDETTNTVSPFGRNATNAGFWARTVNSGTGLDLVYNTGIICTMPNLAFAQGAWAHVCHVYDGGQGVADDRGKWYVNGSVVASTYAGTIPATLADAGTSVLKIGRATTAATHLQCKMAALKIWTASLTAAEVQAEVNTVIPKRTANLYLWSPLDDALSAVDYSGNGRNGTQSGGAVQVQGPPVSWGAPFQM